MSGLISLFLASSVLLCGCQAGEQATSTGDGGGETPKVTEEEGKKEGSPEDKDDADDKTAKKPEEEPEEKPEEEPKPVNLEPYTVHLSHFDWVIPEAWRDKVVQGESNGDTTIVCDDVTLLRMRECEADSLPTYDPEIETFTTDAGLVATIRSSADYVVELHVQDAFGNALLMYLYEHDDGVAVYESGGGVADFLGRTPEQHEKDLEMQAAAGGLSTSDDSRELAVACLRTCAQGLNYAKVDDSQATDSGVDAGVIADFHQRYEGLEATYNDDWRWAGNMAEMREVSAEYSQALTSFMDDLFAYLVDLPGVDSEKLRLEQDEWEAQMQGAVTGTVEDLGAPVSGNYAGLMGNSSQSDWTKARIEELFALADSL